MGVKGVVAKVGGMGTDLGMDPFSLRGAVLAGHRARFLISPITAFTSGHLGGR